MAEEFEEKHLEWVQLVLANPRNLASEVELIEQSKVALRRFLLADIDASGSLSFDELKRLCDEMGLPMGDDEEEALIKMDTDGNGTLDVEEWVLWWMRRYSTLPNPLKQQEAIAKNTFQKFDIDNSGYLSVSELGSLLHTLGADFTDDEVQAALDEMDTDQTGSIECNEFIAWWTNRAGASRGATSLLSLKLRKLAAKASKQFHTDIFKAAWQGDIPLVKAFLEGESRLAHATDDSEYGESWSALQYAAYRGHLEVVKLLLEAGAQVNYANSLGFTALFYAAQQGHIDVCEELFAHAADPGLYGSHPDSEAFFLCAADFMTEYPQLRELFKSHKRMQPPEPVHMNDILQCSLAGGQLTMEITPPRSKTTHLPTNAYRCRIIASPSEALAPLVNLITTEVKFKAKKPSSSVPAVTITIDHTFWEQLSGGLYLQKIETLRPSTISLEVLREAWNTLCIYYNALDGRRKKQIVLEDKLWAALERGVGAADDVETATKEADTLKTQLTAQMQVIRDSSSKVLSAQELINEAFNALGLTSKQAAEKRPLHPSTASSKAERKAQSKPESKPSSKSAEKESQDSKAVAGGGGDAGNVMASLSKHTAVVSSNRAPWTVTVSLTPINAFQEGPTTSDIPVKVSYIKL